MNHKTAPFSLLSNTLFFTQEILFQPGKSDSWRIHPRLKKAALLGFALGFAGFLFANALWQPEQKNSRQSIAPAADNIMTKKVP